MSKLAAGGRWPEFSAESGFGKTLRSTEMSLVRTATRDEYRQIPGRGRVARSGSRAIDKTKGAAVRHAPNRVVVKRSGRGGRRWAAAGLPLRRLLRRRIHVDVRWLHVHIRWLDVH